MALTLNGTTGISGIAGSAGTPALQGNNDTNTGYFFATDTVSLSTAGTERLRITSAGLMGLGTNNPSRMLHVKSAGANATQIALIDNDSTNEVFQIGQQSDGDCFVSIRDDSGNTKISFDASGDSFFDGGKVGFGVAAPTGTLSVASGTWQSTTPESTGDDIVISGSNSLGMQFLTLASNTSNNNIYFGDTDDVDVGMIRYAHADNSMQFRTNATEKLRINSDGNVGIGTTAPTKNLHIEGTAHTGGILIHAAGNHSTAIDMDSNRSSAAGGLAELNFKWNGTTVGQIGAYAGADTTNKDDGDIYFGTATAGSIVERLRIKSDGRIVVPDNGKFIVGSNEDLEIWHDANNSRIHDTGTGVLAISGSDVHIQNNNQSQSIAKFLGGSTNSSAELYYNDAKVFHTTSDGIYVTGIGRFTRAETALVVDQTNTADVEGCQMRHARGGLSGFTGKMISFRGNDETEEGSIVIGTTATAYNTSSDYRLKENQVAISDGITRVKQLKPYRFNFKKDTGTTVDGFFAHEVSDVVPEAISGAKDAMAVETRYEEGDSIPSGKFVGDPKTFSSTKIDAQQIDQSKLVPLLTAALQEAITEIETLKTKVTALESA